MNGMFHCNVAPFMSERKIFELPPNQAMLLDKSIIVFYVKTTKPNNDSYISRMLRKLPAFDD